MKISKLTIAALLTMGLVITGCNSKKSSSGSSSQETSSESSSSSQPSVVERIRVTPLGRTLVVGESINLDDYVTVVGGDAGEKGFTAEVTSGADVVALDGKRVTASAEGEFTITLSAGTKTALFSGSVLTALRAAFKDYINSFPSEVYGVQEQTYDGEGNIVDDPDCLIIHQEDYFGHYSWSNSDPKVGGYLKAGDGSMYKWKASDLNGTNFEAVPGPIAPVANWSLYFVNTPLYFNFADFAMTDYPESTDQLLAITGAAAAQADLTDYFNCAIDQLMYCGLGYDFEDDTNKTLYVHASETDGVFSFSFELFYTAASDSQTYSFPFRFLTGDDAPALSFVQDYVDSGEHPEAVDFSEYTAKATAAVTSKNYAFQIVVGFFNSSTFAYYNPTNTPAILSYLGVEEGQIDNYANNAYYSLTETGVMTATGRYSSISEAVFENAALKEYSASEFGYIEHESKLYRFSRVGGVGAFTTTDTGLTELWSSVYCGSTIVPNAQFEVSSKTDNGDGSYTFGFAQGAAAIGQLGDATAKLGRYTYYKSGQLQYMLGRLVVGAEGFQFTFGVNFGGGIMWGASLTVTQINGGNVLPVDEATIFGA